MRLAFDTMSTSWLSTKPVEISENQGVPNPTNDHNSSLTDPARTSNDKGKRTFTATYTTPHDEVLAELHGSLSFNDPAKDIQGTSPELESTGELPKDHPSSAAQQPSIRFPSSDVLIDPFDGSNLGVLVPHSQGSESQNPSLVNLINNLESGLGAMNTNPAGSEAVWSQLSRVLDIQSEISRMHLEMESIGLRAGSGDWNGKRHQWKGHPKTAAEKVGTTLDPSIPPGLNWPRQRAMSTVSTISSGEPGVDEYGVNFHDEEEEKSRVRGEEFAKLSSQFEGRKEAIHDIMAKLDDLSKTLSEFHALPIPNIEFSSSRNNALGTPPTIDTPPDPKVGARRSVKKSSSRSLSIDRNIRDSQTASVSSPPIGPLLHQTQDEISPDIPTSQSQKREVPALLVSSLELGKHPLVMESHIDGV